MGVRDNYSKSKGKSGLGVRERYELKKLIGETNYEVNQDFINSFFTDAKSYLDTYEADYGNLGWSTASSAYEDRNSKWLDLYARSSAIRKYLNSNRDKIDNETYKGYSSALDSFVNGAYSIANSFRDAKDFYSQWYSEESYNLWVEARDRAEQLKSDALNNKELASEGLYEYERVRKLGEWEDYDINKDGEKDWWEYILKGISDSGWSADTSLPNYGTSQVILDNTRYGAGGPSYS